MNIPGYILKSAIVLLSVVELRKWIEMYLAFKNNVDDDSDEAMPESVKHMYT